MTLLLFDKYITILIIVLDNKIDYTHLGLYCLYSNNISNK